jgi:hypothetical protein
MDQKRKQLLLKTLRGNNFRRALKAIAELGASSDAATVSAVAQTVAPDEQRDFQVRVAAVVMQKGIKGLVDEWTTLGDTKWRAELISEIGQFVDLWVDKNIIELVIVALNDSDRPVQVKAVWTLLAYVTETSDKKKRTVESKSQMRFLDGAATVCGWITPEQRSRITQALSVMLKRHRQTPYPVLPQIVEALGYTACKKNREVIEQLEGLCNFAGEPYRISYETVNASNYAWFEKLVTAKKGIAPEQITRIIHAPTGLLDRKLLEAAWHASGRAKTEIE